MRFLTFIFVFQILASCNETQPSSKSGTTNAIQVSNQPAITNPADARNWCQNQFTDAVPINADTSNMGRRFFLLGEGIHRVAVQLGNMTSSFLIRKAGEKSTELFTSDNFPLCLSKRENFNMAENGTFFKYDNHKGVEYSTEVQVSPEGLFVVLTFPPDVTYGLNVHRCVGCR